MDDFQRDYEQRALQNVRALVDKLERSDPPASSRRLIWAGGAALLALLLAMVVSGWMREQTEAPLRAQRGCELDAFAKRSAEREAALVRANPTLQPQEVRLTLARERPFTEALAKSDCDSTRAR